MTDALKCWLVTDWMQTDYPGHPEWIGARLDAGEKMKAVGFNALGHIADVAINDDRPHIIPVRTPTKTLKQVGTVLKATHVHLGMKNVLFLDNEPSWRKGRSEQMAGLAYTPDVTAAMLYSKARLKMTKMCWSYLLKRSRAYVDWAALYLENSLPESVDWTQQLAAHLIEEGIPPGRIICNGIGHGEWGKYPHVLNAESKNSLNAYEKAGINTVPNDDGMWEPIFDQSNAYWLAPRLEAASVGHPAMIHWDKNFRGKKGMSIFRNYMWRHFGN